MMSWHGNVFRIASDSGMGAHEYILTDITDGPSYRIL